MGAEAFVPDPAGNILLIGDSIVWGGNPYKAGERLGARLQALLKDKVWTASAGSWSLQNEIT
jgi:lysophospholipase L1-like esterase